ncbi:FitA-like ribbon-helix-helix domain-containing protein [Microbacterium bovistercoris]|uniref:FitA-like ribbon-helix-helix domain-containing protein n=1 Tax=Microbacterium bovistercoris TaxID=2293570 RepID=UPI0015F27591|nr:hypothetical protein [Microbacterium bovistercoris]
MAAITIRNLSDDVVDALKKRAKRNGRSMEAEAREALFQLAAGEISTASGLEQTLVQRSSPRRSVPMRDVMERIAANPRTTQQRQTAQDWAQEIEDERRLYILTEDELIDPWERAELQARLQRKEQGE